MQRKKKKEKNSVGNFKAKGRNQRLASEELALTALQKNQKEYFASIWWRGGRAGNCKTSEAHWERMGWRLGEMNVLPSFSPLPTISCQACPLVQANLKLKVTEAHALHKKKCGMQAWKIKEKKSLVELLRRNSPLIQL